MRSTWHGDGYGGGGRSQWTPFSLSSVPVTRGLLVATIVTFLLYFFTGQDGGPVARYVPFYSNQWYLQPWTFLTYPFLEFPSLWILMTLYVLYSMGGMLERSWGSINFAAVFFAFTVIGALAFLIPLYLLGRPVALLGLTVPLIALVTAWAALDPDGEVSFWGIPTRPKIIAGIWVLLNYFQFGIQYKDPILALFILAAPAAAWFYVRKMPRLNLSPPTFARSRRPEPRRPLLREEPVDDPRERERVTGFNPLRRRQEQEEIARLRKLLGEDDDDRPVRR